MAWWTKPGSEQAEAERAESLASLERGGLPLRALRRIDHETMRPDRGFTSNFSVNELLVARHAGVKPISQVMGSSIYYVSWQFMPRQPHYPFTAATELGTAIAQSDDGVMQPIDYSLMLSD